MIKTRFSVYCRQNVQVLKLLSVEIEVLSAEIVYLIPVQTLLDPGTVKKRNPRVGIILLSGVKQSAQCGNLTETICSVW